MTNSRNREPGDIEALLPWYAKGRLTAAETLKVEAYLAANPQANATLALIREELDETIAANESLRPPSAAARDRLMAAIAAEAGASAAAPSHWQRVKAAWASRLQGISPGMAFGGALAGLVIIVQAAALGVLLLGREPGTGGTGLASGKENPATAATVLIVRFTGDAKAADIAALLKPLGAVIVDGPKPDNVFKVRITGKPLSEAERAAIIGKLRERNDIVSFVAPGA